MVFIDTAIVLIPSDYGDIVTRSAFHLEGGNE